MSKTQVRLGLDGPHATITFTTDGGINVLNSEVMREFQAVIAKVAKQHDVRSTAIHAEGKVFVAGADIKEMARFTPDQAHAYGRMGQEVFGDLAALPSITVAAINGAALGGGWELALACDFRIAVKSAKLGLPETSLGLIPGWGGISRLSKLVGPARAKRLFLSAQPISAEEGLAFGLVDELVNAADDLPSRVAAFCKSFRRASPAAVALAKRALRDGDDLTAFADCFSSPESREGMHAFIEKRSASWME
ncbi:MAG: enoyl-CoA hydratase/isomerase family protein [Planctomycetes bacterium]|nr:enoyl-CoA hydratase/isomerase family protein [Planctomycetota bacterium]